MDIKCPQCGNPVIRDFEGNQVQGYCAKCKIEVKVTRKKPVPLTASSQ